MLQFGFTHKHLTKLEKIARGKPSSLLRTFENYGRKKFYNIDSRLANTENDLLRAKLAQAIGNCCDWAGNDKSNYHFSGNERA